MFKGTELSNSNNADEYEYTNVCMYVYVLIYLYCDHKLIYLYSSRPVHLLQPRAREALQQQPGPHRAGGPGLWACLGPAAALAAS